MKTMNYAPCTIHKLKFFFSNFRNKVKVNKFDSSFLLTFFLTCNRNIFKAKKIHSQLYFLDVIVSLDFGYESELLSLHKGPPQLKSFKNSASPYLNLKSVLCYYKVWFFQNLTPYIIS